MIGRLRETGLLWPAVFAVPTFCLLIALGNWQWSRMHWKQGLLNNLARAEKADPIPLRAVPWASVTSPDTEAMRFRRVTVVGTFEHQHEMHVWSPAAEGPAWSVVTPLRLQPDTRSGARARASHVLVIRGIVPAATKPAAKRKSGQVAGRQIITGRIRLDQPNTWAYAPNIPKNEWFTRDLAAMTQRLRTPSEGDVEIAPFFIEAEQQLGGPAAPKPQLQALTLSNRHLEYALTWWALAATLAGVFAAFAWGRLKGAKT